MSYYKESYTPTTPERATLRLTIAERCVLRKYICLSLAACQRLHEDKADIADPTLRKQQQSYIKDRIAVLQEVVDMLRGENKEIVLTERQRVELVGMLKKRIREIKFNVADIVMMSARARKREGVKWKDQVHELQGDMQRLKNTIDRLAVFDVNYHLKKEKPLYRAVPNA